MYIDQLMNNNNMMSWKQFKQSIGEKPQGKIPKWFHIIVQKTAELNPTLENLRPKQLELHKMNIINSSIGEHDVYTDGSFQNIFTKDIKSGAACYWKQLELTTSIASTARSSTQAELHAIILCLQNASYEMQLRIHTDSQVAIQSISKSNASIRSKICNQFSEEIQEIEQLIQNKRLKVEYIKVKGHAGIIENEKADQEVKKATCNSSNHIHFFNNSAKLATSTNEIITSDLKRYFQKWFTNRAILEWQANDLHLNLQDQLTKKGTNWKLSL